MRVIKSVLKYLSYYILGTLVAAMVSLAMMSYFAVDNLTFDAPPTGGIKEKNVENSKQAPARFWINPNFQEVSQIGAQYVTELNAFDRFMMTLSSQKPGAICNAVCNPSSFDQERARDERSEYLLSYYELQGPKAFADPLFRLKMREMSFLSDLFPVSLRDILSQASALRGQSPTFFEKFSIALRLEATTVKEAFSFRSRWTRLKIENKNLDTLRNLIFSCQNGALSQKEAMATCHARLPNESE